MPSPALSSPVRLFFVFANLLLGLLPSFAFLVWVERNASLPRFGSDPQWPWISWDGPLPLLCAWNCGLLLAFGAIHSVTAQPALQKAFQGFTRRWLPAQALRTLYVALSGMSLWLVMGLWQNTGVVLWAAPWGFTGVNILSLVLYWGFLAAGARALSGFDGLEFLGLKQLYGMPGAPSGVKLQTHGLYSRVRHPLYALMLAAFVVTPFMTLDRALVAGTIALYLSFAIPLEERKLVAQFGQEYERYRRAVPALVPIRKRG